MRPLLLEFQAFGSYPGREVVDFEVLVQRGLFVVTGPTGTGKTTVFDAMVYALYGVLPGGRSADGEPRSHHAAIDVVTYVELTFEAGGRRYRVRRTPPQQRPKHRGEGTTEQPPEATLVELVGDTTVPLATKVSNCTTRCTELVGLDARQFQRVVLLPQGKFTDFLIATDDDRERLLRQLFGGEIFEAATRLLKERTLELEQQVKGIDDEVRRHRRNADDSYVLAANAWPTTPDALIDPLAVELWSDVELRAALAVLQPVRDAHLATVEARQADADVAAALAATSERRAKLFDDAAEAQARLDSLSAHQATAEAAHEQVQASAAARPVVQLHATAERLRTAARDAAAAVAAVHADVAEKFALMGRPAPPEEPAAVAAAVQAADGEFAAQRQRWQAAQDVATKADAAEAAHLAALAAHEALVAHVARERAAVQAARARLEVLEPALGQVATRAFAHEAAEARVANRVALETARSALTAAELADATARTAYESVMARFVATQAPRLAVALRPHEPCPVCGSAEHPHKATLAADDVVDHDEVDAARARWSIASAKVATLTESVAARAASLGEQADVPEAVLRQELAGALAAWQEATALVAEHTAVRADLEARSAAFELLDAQERTAGTSLAELRNAAAALRAEARRLATVVADIDANALERATWTVQLLQRAIEHLPQLHGEAVVASTQLRETERLVAEALVESGYASVDDASAALLPAAEEQRLARQLATWREEFAATTQRLHTLREQGVPDSRPDDQAAAFAARAATAAAKEAARTFTTADNAFVAAHRHLDLADDVAADSSELRARRDDARIVFRTCNGEAGMRVKLERWVLAAELDRVTAAANEHLARMTNHRYRLNRSTGTKGGLTLEVFDAHTGRSRATASLSGGEQFQASLSLALGLADVVSLGGNGNGRVFEALFVDEGFGSLDPVALDDAIEALGQLHAAGRMVGAITHVEAMQQQLHVGIQVLPLPDGRGSTLVVNP